MKLYDAISEFLDYRHLKVVKTSLEMDSINLGYFALYMRDVEIENVTLGDIVGFLERCKKIKVNPEDFMSPNTVLKKAVSLRKLFEFYYNDGFDVLNYRSIPLWPKKFVFPRVADRDDYETFLAAIPENNFYHFRNKTAILTQGASGMRISEVCRLDISGLHDDMHGATIITSKSKGKCPIRRVRWNRDPRVADHIEKWLKARENLVKEMGVTEPDALFINCRKNYRGYVGPLKRVTTRTMEEWYRRYSRMAGFNYLFNSHSLRHALARDLTENGAECAVISSVLGHASLQSSYQYERLFGKKIDQQYDKFLCRQIDKGDETVKLIS